MTKKSSLFKKYISISAAAILLNALIVLGVLRLFSFGTGADFHKAFDSPVRIIMLIIAVILLLAVNIVIVFFSAKLVSDPIKEITKSLESVSEGELKLSDADIEEIYRLECALKSLYESIEENDKSKSRFVSNVSHELRTPLTSISGFIDGIIDGTIPKERQPYYLNLVSQEIKRLARLTRLMLSLERLESGEVKPDMNNINVINIIVDVLNSFESAITKNNLDIRGLDSDKVLIFADGDLIHQAIYNLVENAVKFTPKNGYIEFCFKDDADYNYISVKNSGEGLNDQEKEKVFNRFYKTDSSNKNDSVGAGLGLNIVRSILRIHNGDIFAESVQGEYTEFVFSIPKNNN